MMHQLGPARHLRFETLVERSARAIPGPFVAGPVEASADYLAEDLSATDNLSLDGVHAARTMILHALQAQRRLRRARPFIEHTNTDAIVIGGVPRSGATLLHQVLACTSPVRNLAYWQALHPTAQIEARRGLAEYAVPRAIAAAECRADELRLMEPVFARHPVDNVGVAECTPLLSSALDSLEIPMMFDVPSFRDRMLGRSHAAEFECVAEQLAAIEGPSDLPWLLKSPFFLVDYDAMLAMLKPSVVIHVQRPAVDAFSSFVEFAAVARRQTTANVNARAVAREMLDLWVCLLPRAADALALPRVEVATVDYDQLVRTPAVAVAALREQLPALHAGELHVARVEAIAREQRRRHLPASSSIEDFGLSSAEVTRRLEEASRGYFFAAA